MNVLFFNNDVLTLNVLAVGGTVVVVSERRTVDGMGNTFSYSFDAATKAVVMSVVVVIAHSTLGRRVRGVFGSSFSNPNSLVMVMTVGGIAWGWAAEVVGWRGLASLNSAEALFSSSP